MRLEFTQKTEVSVNFLKSLSREKSTQDVKMCFINGNELKLTQVELILFFIFKSVSINVKHTNPIIYSINT